MKINQHERNPKRQSMHKHGLICVACRRPSGGYKQSITAEKIYRFVVTL